MRFYNELHMGEGISGLEDVGAGTSALYSCIGIGFANTRARLGGLYHYPSGEIGNPNVAGAIRQMSLDIGPDRIVLTPAFTGYGMGSTDADITALESFLRGVNPGAQIERAGGRVSAQFIWQRGAPVFNVLPDQLSETSSQSGAEEGEVPPDLRGTFSSGRRSLGGGARYYGGDGEARGGDGSNRGVLDQGRSSGPSHGPTASGGGARPGRRARISRKIKPIWDRCIVM